MRHTPLTLTIMALALLTASGSALAQATPAASFDAALKTATANNQLAVVDFYTDW